MGDSEVACSAVDKFCKDRLNSSDGYRSVIGGFMNNVMGISIRVSITTQSSFHSRKFPPVKERREKVI
jgi:hypothetical protein